MSSEAETRLVQQLEARLKEMKLDPTLAVGTLDMKHHIPEPLRLTVSALLGHVSKRITPRRLPTDPEI